MSFRLKTKNRERNEDILKTNEKREPIGFLFCLAEREALRAIPPKAIKHAQTSILRAFVFF